MSEYNSIYTGQEIDNFNQRIMALENQKCNKNLLDNWYFIGGGSQLGDGVFPINQRGQTSYSNAKYGVDRWQMTGAMSCTVNSGNVLIKSTAASHQWYQILSYQNELVGKKVTFSALTASNILIQTTVNIPSTLPSETQTIGYGSSKVNGYSLYIRTTGGKLSAVVYANSTFTSAGISIIAMKLEIGSEQTLAHNEGTDANPAWVLNEIPDYSVELSKCQRYLQLIPASADYMVPLGYGLAMSATEYRITIPLPTLMVKTPTITILNCLLRFYQENLSSGSYISTYSAVSVIGGNAATLKYKTYVCLRFTVSGATSAKPVTMIVTGQNGSNMTSGILLSAED